jgi:hypothetical protein
MTLVRDAKAQVTLDKREARERASRVEVESAAVLASTSGEEEDLFGGLPISRVSLLRRFRLKIWPRRTPGACLMRRLEESKGSVENRLRSSPFYKPGSLSCCNTPVVRGV